MSTGQWYHVAYVRESGTLKMYFNGTVDSNTQSYSSQFGKTGTVYLGDQHAGGGGAPQYYIDDLRVTKGLARYTSNFTAPTTAHLTSAGDSLKNIVVNEDADGIIIGTSGISTARIAKAWAEFDGSGVTLNASYNVSSITDHGNRDYTINFSTAMADTNYSIVGSNIGQTASYNWSVVTGMGTAKTTSAARINVPHINDSSLYGNDPDAVNVIAFGN
jgi:hypothetical protein